MASLRQTPQPPDPRLVVKEDTHVERTDLGTKDVFTFVAAGDAVPAHLADLPRRKAPKRPDAERYAGEHVAHPADKANGPRDDYGPRPHAEVVGGIAV